MRPNILLIMTDQFRSDAINAGRGTTKHTPSLDMLLSESTSFTRAVTTSPICAPARASLLASLYPHQMHIWDNKPHTFPPEAKNWVKILKCLGYHTSVFGKTHYYPYNGSVPDMRDAEDLLHAYGYDVVDEIPGPRVSGTLLSHMTALWEEKGYRTLVQQDLQRRYAGKHTHTEPSPLPLELYPDVYVGNKAYDYLASYQEEEPFFCFVSFGGPHDPWDCPKQYTERFENQTMERPLAPFTDLNVDRTTGNWDTEVHHPPLDLEDIEAVRRNYAGKVSLIDEQIGRLATLLKEKNLWDDTLVIFTSDHGELLGDHHRLYKQNFLNPALLIPLLIKTPYQSRGQATDSLAELVDIGPTLVDYAQGEMDYPHCGRSLRSILEQQQEKQQKLVFSEYNHEIMAYDGEWKLVVNQRMEPYLLFNLIADPNEQLNVVTCHPHVEQALVAAIRNHLQATSFGFTNEGNAYV